MGGGGGIGGERLAQQPSLLLIHSYESAVTYTTAKDAFLLIAVSNCTDNRHDGFQLDKDHRHQSHSQQQHGSWTLMWI